jgi:hypothetical protein
LATALQYKANMTNNNVKASKTMEKSLLDLIAELSRQRIELAVAIATIESAAASIDHEGDRARLKAATAKARAIIGGSF